MDSRMNAKWSEWITKLWLNEAWTIEWMNEKEELFDERINKLVNLIINIVSIESLRKCFTRWTKEEKSDLLPSKTMNDSI